MKLGAIRKMVNAHVCLSEVGAREGFWSDPRFATHPDCPIRLVCEAWIGPSAYRSMVQSKYSVQDHRSLTVYFIGSMSRNSYRRCNVGAIAKQSSIGTVSIMMPTGFVRL